MLQKKMEAPKKSETKMFKRIEHTNSNLLEHFGV